MIARTTGGAGQQHAGKCAMGPGMAPQKGERIGVGAFQQGGNGLFRWFHETPQISFAYSPMVRSEENQPTLAMLRMAAERQLA